MASEIVNEPGCANDVELWRDIVKNNKRSIQRVFFLVITDETWLPNVLVQTDFFESGNMVKKNQKELWRDIQDDEVVKLSWASIRVVKVGFPLTIEPNPAIIQV